MKKKVLFIVGSILLLLGILGFLASSVQLASANKAVNISAGEGIEVTLPDDDVTVVQRKNQAESVLFPSLFLGVFGCVFIVLGFMTKSSLPVVPLRSDEGDNEQKIG